MRHKKKGRKLGRTSAHRKALCRNILRSLFTYGKIITTISKAKEFSPIADRIITYAKKAERKIQELEKKLIGDKKNISDETKIELYERSNAIRVAYLRLALKRLPDKDIVLRVFYDIAPLFKNREGGYTSVIKLNKRRVGDNAQLAVLRLVENLPFEEELEKNKEERKKKIEQEKEEIEKLKEKVKEKAKKEEGKKAKRKKRGRPKKSKKI